MSQEVKLSQARRCWVGVDWGEFNHAVSVVDDGRELVTQFTVGASLEGLAKLEQRLGEAGEIAGIAIESTSNLLVAFLVSKGYAIYLVNPKLSKNWREGISVGGVKSDTRDGLVLAVELARRHESLRPLKRNEDSVMKLASLCETVRDLVNARTELLQSLKAVLRQYFPAALGFFCDWSSPVAWRFLKRFPRPEVLAKTRKDTLCRFLKSNRIGLSPRWMERIDGAGAAADWPCPQNSVALELKMQALVAQLQALQPQIDRCDKLIAEACKALPQAELLSTLPGAGVRLAPALTAITVLVANEEDRMQAMRCLSGIAPVEHSSGKKRQVRMRTRCNKHWRNIFHLYARLSVQHCAWARAYYDICRERGDKFATALRKLAAKWIKIIEHMVAKNEPYDDARYVEALKKKASPVYARLCGKPCGQS